MQCHGALKRPLRSIIKSIGGSSHSATSPKHGFSRDYARDQSRPTGSQRASGGDPRDGHRPRQHDERWRIPHVQPGWASAQGNHGLGRGTLYSGRHRSQRRRFAEPPRRFCSHSGHGGGQASAAAPERGESGAGEEARGASADGPEQGLAHIEHERHDSEAMIVRRVHGSSSPRAPTNTSVDKHTPNFEDVVKEAEDRPRDGTCYRYKSDDQLKPRYFGWYRSVTKHHLQRRFRQWEIQKERHLRPSSDDWRKVLYLLEDATPTGEEHFKKTLEAVDLPANVSVRFKGNAGVAILDIMQRTGSHVQLGSGVLARSASGSMEQPFSSMSLLGSPRENAAALKILPRYVEVVNSNVGQRTKDLEELLRSTDKSYWDEQDTLSEAEIEKLEDVLDQVTDSTDRPRDPAIPIRALWTEDRLKKDASMPPERLLRRPTFWTPAKLAMYIERLTDKRPRQVMQRLFRHKQDAGSYVWHVNIVTEELKSLLTDEVLMQDLTASALDRALQYLTKHSKYHVFRTIFAFLEHNVYEFTVSNWNVLLAAAAKAGDVFNFKYILKCMIDRKVPRTPVTWALFHDLMSRRFPLEAGIVVETMRKKGLLVDNKAASLIAANSAGNELTAHLAMKGDLESFYRLYDNRFGLSYGRFDFEWLNINVANRMCNVLLATGKVHDAFNVVGDYLERNGKKNRWVALETTTLNIFLTSALRDRNPATAIAMLQRFRVSQPGAMAPDHITYQILFTIAWRQKHYNMLRVIWRYACAAGYVAHAVQSRMKAGMLARQPKEFVVKETGAMGQLWVSLAAKFAVGLQHYDHSTDSHSKGATRTAAGPNRSSVQATFVRHLSLPHLHRDPSEVLRNKEEAEQILASDLSQVQKVAPVLPFPDLLEEALKKDMDWQQRGFGGPKGYIEAGGAPQMFEQMLREGIEVPVKEGDYTKYARPWEVPRLLFDRRVNDRA